MKNKEMFEAVKAILEKGDNTELLEKFVAFADKQVGKAERAADKRAKKTAESTEKLVELIVGKGISGTAADICKAVENDYNVTLKETEKKLTPQKVTVAMKGLVEGKKYTKAEVKGKQTYTKV